MIYSIPYMIFFFFLLVLSVIVSEKKEDEALCRNLTYLAITVFFIFFGCRGYIWHDWTIYANNFDKISWSDLFSYDYTKHREPIWLFFELICKTIVDDYFFMAFVQCLINTILLVRFFRKYSISVLFALATYLAFNGFEISINLMRNSMAIFIFLNAIPCIEEKKIGRYLLLCTIATGIHFSSVIYIPMYFILNRNINKWVFLAVVLVSYAVLFSNMSIVLKLVGAIGISEGIFATKIDAYSGFGMFGVSRFMLLQHFIITMMVFCYYEKLKEMSPHNRIFINALLICIVGSYLTSEFTEMSKRIGILFSFSFWILSGYLIKCCYYINNRRLFIGFMTLVLIFNTYTSTAEKIKEYQNWLFGTAEPYEIRLNSFNRNFVEIKQINSNKK